MSIIEILINEVLNLNLEDALTISDESPLNYNRYNSLEIFNEYLQDLESKSSINHQEILEGRLGPNKVYFDLSTHVGSFIIGTDRLGLGSQSNFGSIRANVCVFKGKWQYELLLGSKGVMQIGWATHVCQFSQEKGVGDTPDSYGFDGNRLRKWNVESTKYGETWLNGDIIGCCLDLDEGKIEFFRNGKSLGIAFDNIRIAPGIAYFPAVSLGHGENLIANFGSTPFKYPIDLYKPIQYPPSDSIAFANFLLQLLKKLMFWFSSFSGDSCNPQTKCKISLVYVTAYHILTYLGPLLKLPYVVEACMLNFLEEISHHDKLFSLVLDICWLFSEENRMKKFLECLVNCLLTRYRQVATSLGFVHQHSSLNMLTNIIKHKQSRHFLLKYVFFDRIRFPSFMHLKPLDIEAHMLLVPHAYWPSLENEEIQNEYKQSCTQMYNAANELENSQVIILSILLDNNDYENDETSRTLFLKKFRIFLKENMLRHRISTDIPVIPQIPLSVMLCLFHRLIRCFHSLWAMECPDQNFFPVIPVKKFYDNSLNYFDAHRLGGLASHLRKLYQTELEKLMATAVNKSAPIKSNDCNNKMPQRDCDFNQDCLLELLDGLIWLYHIGAHKHLLNMSSLRDNLNEFVDAFEQTKLALSKKEQLGLEIMTELQQSCDVFLQKITDLSRHIAWINAIIFNHDNQQDVVWLLKVTLNTLNVASSSGIAFSFVPDFYVNSLFEMFVALNTMYHPTIPLENIEDFEQITIDVGIFLVEHFADERILFGESKDMITQSLASFICNEKTLKALEKMPNECCQKMIRLLLRPYESRSWAQSNWILLRLWKGNGFAFRYTKAPHQRKLLYPMQPQNDTDILGHTNHYLKPCPSQIFQQYIADILLSSHEFSSAFLNSLLNQLNWAFSEFIGLMQEIQNAFNRPERIFIDARQLKLCSTCFDLTLALLRVLEMIVHVALPIFYNSSHPTADLLLTRLSQLLSQIFNRITNPTGCFNHVISMALAGLESIDPFPILTASAGVMIQLLHTDIYYVSSHQNATLEMLPATKMLLEEPSFQISSLHCLLGKGHYCFAGLEIFDLHNYPEDVSVEELQSLQLVVDHLELYQRAISISMLDTLTDEDICTICYAYRITVKFLPCGHFSCLACISQHLMNKSDCFFCKNFIETIVDLDNNPIKNLWTKN